MTADSSSDSTSPVRPRRRSSNGVSKGAILGPAANDSSDKIGTLGEKLSTAALPSHPVLALQSILSGVKTFNREKHAEVVAWVEREVSAAGVVHRAPSATESATAILLSARKKFKGKGWSTKLLELILPMVQASAQIASADGSLLGKDDVAGIRPEKKLLEDDKDFRPWSRVWLSSMGRSKPKRKDKQRAELGFECDRARVAALRTGWTPTSSVAGFDFSGSACRVDMRLLGQAFALGAVTTKVTVDGEEVAPAATWDNIGWNSDEFGQYVELRQELGEGITLERVVFLPLENNSLFWLDLVRTTSGRTVRVDTYLPLTKSSDWKQVAESRALETTLDDLHLRVLPVGVPSGPLEPSPGGLRVEGDLLHAWIERHGAATVLPFVVHWSEENFSAFRPWRELTVTSDQKLISATEGVAYRVPIEDRMVLFFRSIAGTRRMAFVGHQTFYETLVAEINRKGQVKEWLSVDADPDTPWDAFVQHPHASHHISMPAPTS